MKVKVKYNSYLIEIWKWVVVYVDGERISYKGYYKISNYGRVKSVSRILWNGKGWHQTKSKYLKIGPTTLGYLRVNLSKKGTSKNFGIPHLVLWAFKGKCPEGMECRHLDDNKENNHEGNLEWGTHSQNMQDRNRNGGALGINKGEKNGFSKLTEKIVRKIRFLCDTGICTNQNKLARRFGVTHSCIQAVIFRRTWIGVENGC